MQTTRPIRTTVNVYRFIFTSNIRK